MCQDAVVTRQHRETTNMPSGARAWPAPPADNGWNRKVRQVHRWLSMAFTLTVAANFVAMAVGTPPTWVTYSPLPPLLLLMLSGLHLFAMPYLKKWAAR